MSLIDLFDKISLNDDKNDFLEEQIQLVNAISKLKIENNDIESYINNIKLLRNEWYQLNFCPEPVIYQLLANGLASSCPNLFDHWKMIGCPTTIYQFEYQLFTYFEDKKHEIR